MFVLSENAALAQVVYFRVLVFKPSSMAAPRTFFTHSMRTMLS